jgi:hypothetical protein
MLPQLTKFMFDNLGSERIADLHIVKVQNKLQCFGISWK